MGILSMKAYRLWYFVEKQGFYDENGDYYRYSESSTETEDGWVYLGKCDAVPAGVKNTILLPDGERDTYSFVIRNLPPDCREFKKGERIRLQVLGSEDVNLVVKGFARYQKQCKIWA